MLPSEGTFSSLRWSPVSRPSTQSKIRLWLRVALGRPSAEVIICEELLWDLEWPPATAAEFSTPITMTPHINVTRCAAAIARAELAAKAPPIDYSIPMDSVDIMERVMRHFYLRAMIEQSIGVQADWKRCIQSAVDAVPDNALYPARRSRRRNRNVATALGARAAS